MERQADLVIVGGGPAGLASAIAAGSRALLLERNPRPGAKLLLSGGGQCNFTNALPREEFLRACGNYAPFLKPAFYSLDNQALVAILENAGCPSLSREDGKIFPVSLRSEDVLDTLLRLASKAEATLLAGRCAVRVEPAAAGFRLHTQNNESFHAKQLILAGGGCSWPQTGSDGSAYALAQALGHSLVTPRSALAAVSIQNFGALRHLAGVSLRMAEAVFHTASGRQPARGDLLWTHNGLSGPLILDQAWHLSPGDRISLVLVPRAPDRLKELLALYPQRTLLSTLKRFALPERLLQSLLMAAGSEPGMRGGDLDKTRRRQLGELLSGWQFTIKTVEPLATAMATSGGIPLAEVRARDLQSKLVPGLYFAGEILDYNLPTGGFNLQMAFSTGWLAGSQAVCPRRKK